MKIAVVSGFPPDPHGEAHHSYEAFSRLSQAHPQADITVFAHVNVNSPQRAVIRPNLRVERLTGGPRLRGTLAVLRLFIRILRMRPDVVHFEGTQTSKYGGLFGEPVTALVWALRCVGIPTVVTIHSLWLPGRLSQLWREKGLSEQASRAINRYFYLNILALAHGAGRVNVLSSGHSSEIAEEYSRYYAIPRSKCVLEVHPCNYRPVSANTQTEAKRGLGLSGRFVVSAVGFVRADKGYHLLLANLNKLVEAIPSLAIVIAGSANRSQDQEYARGLENMRNQSGYADHVRFVFKVLSNAELDLLFDAADVVAVPYLESLGPSGPIHHGLGRGKAVIASDIGHNRGLRQVVKLIPPGNADALANAIIEIAAFASQRGQLESAALRYAQQYTWSNLGSSYYAEYVELNEASAGYVC